MADLGIHLDLGLDLTQWCGLFAFGATAAACLHAGRWGARAWQGLACLEIVCGIDTVLGLRYRLHDAVDAIMQAQGAYASRQALQVTLLGAAIVICVTALVWLARRRRQWGTNLVAARAGALLTAGLFVMEIVSLHGIDALMYAFIGPLKTIGWCWLATATWTLSWALRESRDLRTRPGRRPAREA